MIYTTLHVPYKNEKKSQEASTLFFTVKRPNEKKEQGFLFFFFLPKAYALITAPVSVICNKAALSSASTQYRRRGELLYLIFCFPIRRTVSWLMCRNKAISFMAWPSAIARWVKAFLSSRDRGDFAPDTIMFR